MTYLTLQLLAKKYEDEKQKALAEFEQFKKKSKEHEQSIVRKSEGKVDEMTRELEAIKTQFAAQLKAHPSLAPSLPLSLAFSAPFPSLPK